MITKLPWPSQKTQKQQDFAYNYRKNRPFIITDRDYSCGKPLMDAIFEAKIAPLIVTPRISFETIPRDGNYQNVNFDNILVSGYGKNSGIDEQNGRDNEILRLEYAPEDRIYSYIFVNNGVNEEFRSTSFKRLRTKCAHSPKTHGFRNKKYLLTGPEYLQFYQDYTTQNVNPDGPDFDICSYKHEQID